MLTLLGNRGNRKKEPDPWQLINVLANNGLSIPDWDLRSYLM